MTGSHWVASPEILFTLGCFTLNPIDDLSITMEKLTTDDLVWYHLIIINFHPDADNDVDNDVDDDVDVFVYCCSMLLFQGCL